MAWRYCIACFYNVPAGLHIGLSQQVRIDAIQQASKSDFQQGISPKPLLLTVTKRNGDCVLVRIIPTLKDSHEVTEYYEYKYIGENVLNNKNPGCQKRYNGNEYVVDTRALCATYRFKGIHIAAKNLLICFDETATTDKNQSYGYSRITGKKLSSRPVPVSEIFPM
jgi:hypothetical protein